MKTNISAIAPALAQKINHSERRLDDAIDSLADLLGELKTARRVGGIGAEFTQPIALDLSSAIGALIMARGHLVGMHVGMTRVATTLDGDSGDPTGDGGAKPGDPKTGIVAELPRVAA